MLCSLQASLLKQASVAACVSVLLAASGCSYVSKVTDSVTGNDVRVIPDVGMVPLGGKRTPVLNPGGAMYNANADQEEQKLAAENPYLSEGMKMPADRVSGVQYADASAVQGQPGWSGNVYQGSAQADTTGRRVPNENQAMMQSPPTVMAAPVSPLGEPLPPTAYSDIPPAVVAAAPAPAPVQVASAAPLVAAPMVAAPEPIVTMSPPPAITGRDGYPDLAATPPSPAMQPGNYQNNVTNLAAERELAENMRREMMQNPVAAEPGMTAAAPAPVVPAKNDDEFTGWLKNMFNEKDTLAAEQMAAAPAYVPPSAPVATYVPPAYTPPAYVSPATPEPAMQVARQGGLEPIVLTPPPGAQEIPQEIHQEVPMQVASAAPMTSAPALEPITLSPPPEVTGVPAPAGFGGSNMAEPITLQPPVSATNHNVRFLAEGRYASRRGASRMAMAR